MQAPPNATPPSSTSEPPRFVRLLVADDHAVVRRGLRQIVSESPDLRVSAEAGTGDEVIEHVRQGRCDALILDLNMPGPGGVAVLRAVKALNPQLPVLVLSVHAEDQYAARLLRAGASGYLQKESPPEVLLQALRKVCGGERFFKPGQAEELVLQLQNPPSDQAPHASLSDREFEVLRRIASGRTVSQVATDLGLSVKTVSTYRTRLLDKMRMKTNAQLTHYAIKNGLVE